MMHFNKLPKSKAVKCNAKRFISFYRMTASRSEYPVFVRSVHAKNTKEFACKVSSSQKVFKWFAKKLLRD